MPCRHSLSFLAFRPFAEASAFVLLLAAVGCQSPGVKEARKPITLTPVAEPLLDPKKLSSESSKAIKELDLESLHRKDPAELVRALNRGLASAGPMDRRRQAAAEVLCDEAFKLKEDHPASALGWYLAAARITYPAAISSHDDRKPSELLTLYNHACAIAAELAFLESRGGHSTIEGESPLGTESVSFQSDAPHCFDPADFDNLKVAELLKVKGYSEREIEPGLGGSLAGHIPSTEERAAADPFLPKIGMAIPVTATLHFSS
ncbi:MAG: hypothetical protein KDM63_05965, partial [Verrucomicrobiae bacterium]|nr:hypothetical protein [Verrucomicrobiae bacterium]